MDTSGECFLSESESAESTGKSNSGFVLTRKTFSEKEQTQSRSLLRRVPGPALRLEMLLIVAIKY